MSKYKPEKFNFSEMSEKCKFMVEESPGVWVSKLSPWAHFYKDGFTRNETENFFKIMVREQAALYPLLNKSTVIEWKKMSFQIQSWRDPSHEDRGFLEIMVKQIPGKELDGNGDIIGDGELFKDKCNIYRVIIKEKEKFGVTTFDYSYNFFEPTHSNVKCSFSTDRNRFLEDGKTEVEHDSVVVVFNKNTDVKEEDYIISPDHGMYKVDMVAPIDGNMLQVYVQRREVQ